MLLRGWPGLDGANERRSQRHSFGKAADRAQMDQLATTTVIETPAAVDIEGNDRLDDAN
jgi:hypothetical protein